MTDDQQQPNEFPAPKPLPGSVYIRPGIDDRPDYDKVLSPEDKSAVARLAVHQPRRKVEASVTQAETQVAQMTSEGSPAAAAASVDTAVPDMGSAYVDMRDPVVSADGQRPNPGQVTRLSWGFAVGATMSIVPWAALNLLALPAVIAKVSWQRVSSAVASRAAFSGGGQELSESLVSRIGAVGDGGVASAWAIDLAVVVVVGVVVSLIAEAVVSALSDRTRVAAGRRTPWIIAGGVVSAVMTLALGLCSNVVGIALLWGLVQVGYVMLTVPMAAAFSERVPDKFRPRIVRARGIGQMVGQALGVWIGVACVVFGGLYTPFAAAAAVFLLAGIINLLTIVAQQFPKYTKSLDDGTGTGVAEGTVERGAAAYGDECTHADGAVPRAAARRRILEGVRFALLGVGWCRTDDHVPVVHRIGADLPGLVHARQLLSDRGTGVLVDRLDDARRLRGGRVHRRSGG